MKKTIIGVFKTREEVEVAIAHLKDKGFNPKDVSIVMKDQAVAKEVANDTGADVASDTVAGATTGAVVGGLAGLLATYALPGLGAFFIGGPIAAALGLGGAAAAVASGAVTGAAAGGLIGALTSTFGLSEEEARTYETRVEEGAILVAVPTNGEDNDVAMEILSSAGADNIKSINMPEGRDGDNHHETTHTHTDA